MTQPEKEFEVGSFHRCNGRKVEYAGACASGDGWGCFKNPDGAYFVTTFANVSPWNPDPKPKSFEERRESVAREIDLTRIDNNDVIPHHERRRLAGLIRSLEPDESMVTYESPTEAVLEISVDEAGAQLTSLYRANTELIQQASVRVKHMVDRFLNWRLPDRFSPDAGISFKPPSNPDWWPVGTNVFDAQQAEAMVRYMVEGLADIAPSPAAAEHDDGACFVGPKLDMGSEYMRGFMGANGDGPWKQAVIDALIVNHTFKVVHEHDPKRALNDLMIYETGIALDPLVSKEAQELIERGRTEAAAAVSDNPTIETIAAKMLNLSFAGTEVWKLAHELRAVKNYRAEWERECNDTDALMQSFGLEPEQYRTEGGSLNVHKARALLDARTRALKKLEAVNPPSDQIKHMVDRFLGWRLPANFNPDNGISYTRPAYVPAIDATPTGTNLFSAGQAEEMVRYMLEGLADFAPDPADIVNHILNSEHGTDPKPKFEDEREACAMEIDVPAGCNEIAPLTFWPEKCRKIAARIRALQPDAPAAAEHDDGACFVGPKLDMGSEYMRGFMEANGDGPWKQAVIEALVVNHILKSEHETDPKRALNDLMIYETGMALDPRISKEAQELIERGRTEAAAAEPVAWMYSADTSPQGTLLSKTNPDKWGWTRNIRPLYLAPPSPPPPNPAAFDEAAERKLFEKEYHNIHSFTKDPTGTYAMRVARAAWDAWKVSAKAQRGAVPAVVDEVREQLHRWARHVEDNGTIQPHEFSSLAAKLGGSNETT